MKSVVIVQARMGSTRFPGKVLEFLQGQEILMWVVNRARQITPSSTVVVATSVLQQDDAIADFCATHGIECYRGSEHDVLARYYETAKYYEAEIVVRITADCPLLDPMIAAQVLYLVMSGEADYASNVLPATWPDGLDCEAFTFATLEQAHLEAIRPSDREHVTPFIRNNQHRFKVRTICSPNAALHHHRWTIDTPEDLAYLDAVLSKTCAYPSTWDILKTLKDFPEIKRPLSLRNEGFEKSLKAEHVECKKFDNSQNLLEKSLSFIPLGAQTFSKSHIQYPHQKSPLFLTHGIGSRVWDVDGNEYIDLVSGLLPIVLGYNDPDVNQAIQNQLHKGISFSLSTELEVELAEKLCQIIPSAEKVRFAKNGTDVTSAAVRLARAYTGRDKIIVCGYHGWQDWYIGSTTRNKGVPQGVSDLTTVVPYNDLEHVETLLKTESYAGMILEPTNIIAPHDGYLSGLKALCERYGSLLIFDEVVTGFRFALGGAQEYFGVMPHLSCFGKAMGNGMPISAIVGQNHVMTEMEEIFFSGTFGGETLSLTASLATIQKLERETVIPSLWRYGDDLISAVQRLLTQYNLRECIKISGYGVWPIFQFLDQLPVTAFDIKTLFIQEMIDRGILINSSINFHYAHQHVEKEKIIQAFNEVFEIITQSLKGNFSSYLTIPAIKPLFKIR